MPPRKQDQDTIKRKQTQKQEFSDLSFDTELSILIPYLKIMPISMQSKFLSPLRKMLEKEVISEMNSTHLQKLSAFSNEDGYDQGTNLFLTQLLCRFLKLNKLKQGLGNIAKRISNRSGNIDSNNHKQYGSSLFQPFEPRIDKESQKIEPILAVINPNYENIVKMFKNFTDAHINAQYKTKQLNESYTFFSQPRFLTKVLEMRDLQANFQQKGNIILMSFEGSKIVGKRGFAFVSQTVIYWWQKNYKDIRDLLPDLNEDKQGKDKDKSKISQNQIKNESQPFRLNQNFKLSFKLVGHHGKITSISLSDDQYYLISTGTDKVIKLWCLRQKSLLAQYRGHTKTIWSVCFSKSGYFFLSGSADKTMKLWSTDDSIPQRAYVGHDSDVMKVSFLSNPDLVISGSEDKTLRIWNALTTDCLNVIKLQSVVVNLKSSLSGRYLIVCDFVGRIVVYDLLKGELVSSFMVPEKEQHDSKTVKYLRIHDVCLSLDQKQFACVSSKYIVVYSFDKICEKQSKNLFAESGSDYKERAVATKQVIYTGRDSNLVYCEYHDKGVLLVASTSHKKY